MKLIRIHYLDASAIVKPSLPKKEVTGYKSISVRSQNFYATSLCFAEALGALKVKRFYRKEISDEQYFCACEELLACAADNTIEIEDVEMQDSMVFVEVENLVRKYKESIDVSDAFQIVSMKRNYFSRFTSDSNPILITGDNALAIAVRQEGIRVWDCVNGPEPIELLQA